MPNEDPMPTVDVVSGTPSIEEGVTFAWTTNITGPITVTARNMPNGNPWFLPKSISFTGPASGPLSPNNPNVVAAANAASTGLGWAYGSNQLSQDGHVVVISTMPEHKPEHKKAS